MNVFHIKYDELFSIDNLFLAWNRFRSGKAGKYDIMSFEHHLENNIFALYEELHSRTYKHSQYEHFIVFDKKKRDIHKACVKDRLVHQLLYDYLSKIFEPIFISDSYSSRKNKGSHKAVMAFKYFMKLAGGRGAGCFILKCDIKKYFDSVNHGILLDIIRKRVCDDEIFGTIKDVVESFKHKAGCGLPLGNITSQIFANIYLNELDWFVKRKLRARFYVRYNDDFVIIGANKKKLLHYLGEIRRFVFKRLKLDVPPEKCELRKSAWGVDFLGFVVADNFTLLRNTTKRNMAANINTNNIASYLGLLSHCDSFNLKLKILADFYSRQEDVFMLN